MTATRKKKVGRWAHRSLSSLICVLFIGFFCLVWQVHAFVLPEALPKTSESAPVTPAESQPTNPEPSSRSHLLIEASNSDRWSDGDVVSALSSFYQTIITMMGVLLGVVGILAVLTLRFLSKSAAEDMAHESAKEAMRHYLETRQFGDNIEFALQETGLADQLESLAKQVENVKALLESHKLNLASDEDIDGEVVPKTDDEIG